MRAVVAGGGIGGLTAALCLARRGWEVCVLERAAALEETGAGIQISPNGMKVMRALGLEDAIVGAGFLPERIEMRFGESGRTVFSIPLAAAARKRWGAPYVHIHRADLLAVLRDALMAEPAALVRTSAEVTGYESSGEGATARLADGEGVAGDLLVGADGIRSAVRARMLGPDAPRFTGQVAWRAVVPVERLGALTPPPTACVWVGRGRHAVTYLLRGGRLANFVGVVERGDWQGESWTEAGRRDEALADFAGWHPTIVALIEQAETHYRWALFDRAPLARWIDGRVALLGDACHPMLPFMAQGAVMGIEDAWVLARCVATGPGMEEALFAYETARKGRTARVQAAARANARTFHQRTALGRIATYGPMWLAARVIPAAVHARQDWLYGFDVTG